ncbi:hypothetical protein, partial [Stenotrophomonas sp. BR163]|uniref:hypothetical protein n=1 Tax=Stenotrophomonas sp. BR163 TaxID=3398459 RepID=UPI0039C6BC51
AVAHKHLGHCHQLWQPDVYERLAGPLPGLSDEYDFHRSFTDNRREEAGPQRPRSPAANQFAW